MKTLLSILSAFLLSIASFAQSIPAYANIVGTRFASGDMNPVLVSPNDGQMVDLRSNPASSDSFISGNSTVDTQSNTYYYTRGNGTQLIKVNMATGNVSSVMISNPNQAIHPIVSPQFNPVDSLIYGLNFIQGQLRLASLDPSTGATSIINPNNWIGDQFLGGDAALDTANGVYYFLRGSTGTQLIAMDIQTGAIQITTVNAPSNSLHTICNIQWNHSNNTLYGLNFKNGFLTISSLDPSTGDVTLLSPNYTSGDGFQNGVSCIDETNKLYHYVAGHQQKRLYSVDITSGQLVASAVVTSNGSSGVLTNIEVAPSTIANARFESTGDCGNTEVKFLNASQGQAYLWDFGDGTTSTTRNPIHTYQQPGTYVVKLYASGLNTSLATDTVTVTPPFTFDLGPDTVLNFGDSIVLYAPAGSSTFWSNGAFTDSLVVTQGGTYWGAAHLNGCSQRDSISIQLQGAFSIDASQGQITGTASDTLTCTISIQNHTNTNYKIDYTMSMSTPNNWSWHHNLSGNADGLGMSEFNLHAEGTAHFHLYFVPHNAGTANTVLILKNNDTGFQETFLLKATLYAALSSANIELEPIKTYPNPAQSGEVITISGQQKLNYKVYSLEGKLIEEGINTLIKAPEKKGVYILKTEMGVEKIIVR